jgi:hypothetical protein
MGIGKECVPPISEPTSSGITAEFCIAFAEQPESILVKPEPHMESVLFNPVSGTTA